MASFLNKLNRMRNVRMHATNEFHMPHPGLYHEIVQGIPWYGGFTRQRPRRLDAGVDKVLSYIVRMRPEYKNYPWCAADNKGVYTHPANFASDRICHLMDLSPTLTLPEAFEIVDKEMSERKAEVDLQVTLAREHAAKLGVVNQGIESLLIRAHRVYGSVFKMKEEEAVKSRRKALADLCRHIQRAGTRLDMQDIIDFIPYRDEQIQFFLDFPEYRKLFPPLWWLSNEVAEAQASATERKISEKGEGQLQQTEGEDTKEQRKRDFFPDMRFMEEDPEGDALATWPPQAIFDRQKRNRVMLEEMHLSGVDPEEAELERAIAEARAALTEDSRLNDLDEEEKQEVIMKAAIANHEEAKIEKLDDFGQLLYDREMRDKRPGRAGILEKEKPEFYEEFREFLIANHHLPAKDRARFQYGEKSSEAPSQVLSPAQDLFVKHVEDGGKLDRDSLRALRESVRGRIGEHQAHDVFEYASGGGAVTLAQLEGHSHYDPSEPRHVNLTSNLDLSPFYPENAFPPRGLLADPNVDLKDPESLPDEYKEQYEELVKYGKDYAHAIEDYAPVKSPEYVVESIRKNKPIVMENTPEKQKADVTKRAENLSSAIKAQNSNDFKSLDEYESKVSKSDEGVNVGEAASEEEGSATVVASEAELQKMKKAALDELAKIAFESDAERKEYEQMLDKRFDYLAAKRKERNQEWAQYWPADKPETLIYRGPEVIREIFPEAYKLAVNRKFEELAGVPLKEALEIKSYVGLWKSVRAREQRLRTEQQQQQSETPQQTREQEEGEEREEIEDLDMSEWQHNVSLDPSRYK